MKRLVVALALVASSAHAAAVPRDPAFNGGQSVPLAIGTGATLTGLAPAPDGGVAAAGTAIVDGRTRTFVERRDAGGAPVAAFAGGRVLSAFGDTPDTARQGGPVAVLPDGRVLAASVAGGRLVVARYLPDGTLDGHWGGGGVQLVTTQSFGADTGPAAVVLRPDGRSLVVGSVAGPLGRSVFAVGFTDIGGIDTSFADRGFYVEQAGRRGRGTPADSLARAVALDAAGNILLAGSRSDRQGRPRALLERLDPNGVRQPAPDVAGALPAARALEAVQLDDAGLRVSGSARDVLGNPAALVAQLGPDFAVTWSRVTQLGRPTRSAAAYSAARALGADGLVLAETSSDATALRVDANGRVACTDRTLASGTTGAVFAAGEVAGTTQDSLPQLSGLAPAPAAADTRSATTGPVLKVSRTRRTVTGVADPGCRAGRAVFVSGRRRVTAARLEPFGGPQTVRATVRKARKPYRLVVLGR